MDASHAVVMRGCACGTLGPSGLEGEGASAVGLPPLALSSSRHWGDCPLDSCWSSSSSMKCGYLRSFEATEVSPSTLPSPEGSALPGAGPAQSWGGVGRDGGREKSRPEMEAGASVACGLLPCADAGGVASIAGEEWVGQVSWECGAAVRSRGGALRSLPGGRILAAR